MKTYKSKIKLGNTEKVVLAVNYAKEEQKAEAVTVDRLHFIHVLDRSGSMSSHLPKLMDEVDETLESMSDNDLISVIWFSGEGECKTVFKGKSKRDRDDIRVMLDTLKRPVGLTCFSEPLLEVNEVIEDLKALCPNFAVTFFTDGQPCVSDYDKEMSAIWKNMELIKDKVMAVNAIGYGYWYNQSLLEKMAGYTTFGRFIHSGQIAEYSDIFSHTYEILSDMVVEKLNIHVSESAEILYLTSKNTKYTHDALQLDFLNKVKNQFFFVVDSEDAVISINDTEIRVSDVTGKIPKPTLNNFFYSMVYELYYLGRADEALDIMAHNIRDKAFIDQHIKAFTANERQEYMETVNKAIFNNKLRFTDGEAPEGYIPAEDAFSVMDLLKLLANGENYYVPLSSSEYNRIGLKVTDSFNLFKANPDQKVMSPINEFIFNAKHLNISMRYMVNGTVALNPIEAKKLEMPKEVDSRIYRTQTIIKDGQLNVTELKTVVDKDTYSRLMRMHAEGIINLKELVKELNTNFKGEAEEGQMAIENLDVTFDLTAIPVINRMYAKLSTPENILETVKEIYILKARQKVFKYFADKIKAKSYANKKTEAFTSYNADQIRLLESHGLNSKLDYQGVGLEKAEKNENDFYESRLLEFTLKGWSSLPKVDEVIDGKKKNAPAEAMKHAITIAEIIVNDTSTTDKEKLDSLNAMIETNKKDILMATIDMNTQKISKVLTGGWWEGLELDKKNNYTFTKDDFTLIIKNDMIKVYF
jgi:hypothetical protein